MKESKAVYVTKHKIRNDRNLIYQLYTQCDKLYKEGKNTDRSSQFDKRDVCTCRHVYKRADYFSRLPKQIYANYGRSFTDIGVGSVKALHRRKVKRVYLPETDDRGVGSSDLSSFIIHKNKCLTSFYDQKKTSSKCVGGILEYNSECVLNEKCSPIVNTKSGTTSPKSPVLQTNNEIGSNTVDKKFITVCTQFEVVVEESLSTTRIKEEESTDDDEISTTSKQENTQKTYKLSNMIEEKKKAMEKRMKEEEKFSTDSLVQHVHNLELPNEEKSSRSSLDLMENTLEREYRKIFATKSTDAKPSNEKTIPEYKSASILRRRFQALRKSLTKKEEMKKGSLEQKSSSHDSMASHKDASVTSDPPSLVGRSYSSTTKKYSPILAHPVEQEKISPPYKTQKDSVYTSEVDSDQGVKGMFKLWGKKFYLEEDSYDIRNPTPIPSYETPSSSEKQIKKKISSKLIEDSPQDPIEDQIIINSISLEKKQSNIDKKKLSADKKQSYADKNQPSVDKKQPKVDKKQFEKEPKKEKKFFFFKKKKKPEQKEDPKDPYLEAVPKNPENITAARCEISEGFTLKVGRPSTAAPQVVASNISEETDEISKKKWLRRFLSHTIESARSVHIRWNNSSYGTSSSTVFELIDTVYKNTEIFIRSRSEVTSVESHCRSSTKNKVNFVQDIQAWMIPKTITDRPIKEIPLKINSAIDFRSKNIELSLSNQKWVIDKKALPHKIEFVLHSRNLTSKTQVSSEYLRIDIPKDFFDSITSDESKRNQTSDEEVFKIVEYESECDQKKGKTKPLENSDVKSDIKLIVSVQDSNHLESRILETVIKRPPMHRDVIIQGSNVNVPKLFDVIGVGIIKQRDLREMRKSLITMQPDSTDIDSNEESPLMEQKKCEFAESYLQEYYRNWNPISVDLYSCVSDSHLKSCSEKSSKTVHNQGDGSKSCPNMCEDYLNSEIMSSCTTSSMTPPSLLVAQQGKSNKLLPIFKKPKVSVSPIVYKRCMPKDSLEVFKKRKLYAHSMRHAHWQCPEDNPGSVPSYESKCEQDGHMECPPKSETAVRSKKRSSKKRVSLADCEEVNDTSLDTHLSNTAEETHDGILAFKGLSPTNKKLKHTCILTEPSSEKPRGPCPTCDKDLVEVHLTSTVTSPIASCHLVYPCESPIRLCAPQGRLYIPIPPRSACPSPPRCMLPPCPSPLYCPPPLPCPPPKCPAGSPACRMAPASLPPPMCQPLPRCPNFPPPQCPPNPVCLPPRRCPPPSMPCFPPRPKCPPPCPPPPCRPPPCNPPPCNLSPCKAIPCDPPPCDEPPPCKTPPCKTPPCKTPPCKTPPCKTPPCKTPPCKTPPCKTPSCKKPSCPPPCRPPPCRPPPCRPPPCRTPSCRQPSCQPLPCQPPPCQPPPCQPPPCQPPPCQPPPCQPPPCQPPPCQPPPCQPPPCQPPPCQPPPCLPPPCLPPPCLPPPCQPPPCQPPPCQPPPCNPPPCKQPPCKLPPCKRTSVACEPPRQCPPQELHQLNVRCPSPPPCLPRPCSPPPCRSRPCLPPPCPPPPCPPPPCPPPPCRPRPCQPPPCPPRPCSPPPCRSRPCLPPPCPPPPCPPRPCSPPPCPPRPCSPPPCPPRSCQPPPCPPRPCQPPPCPPPPCRPRSCQPPPCPPRPCQPPPCPPPPCPPPRCTPPPCPPRPCSPPPCRSRPCLPPPCRSRPCLPPPCPPRPCSPPPCRSRPCLPPPCRSRPCLPPPCPPPPCPPPPCPPRPCSLPPCPSRPCSPPPCRPRPCQPPPCPPRPCQPPPCPPRPCSPPPCPPRPCQPPPCPPRPCQPPPCPPRPCQPPPCPPRRCSPPPCPPRRCSPPPCPPRPCSPPPCPPITCLPIPCSPRPHSRPSVIHSSQNSCRVQNNTSYTCDTESNISKNLSYPPSPSRSSKSSSSCESAELDKPPSPTIVSPCDTPVCCEQKSEPKNEPMIEPKCEPKNEPKCEPKIEPMIEPKNEPKCEPKIEPKNEPIREPCLPPSTAKHIVRNKSSQTECCTPTSCPTGGLCNLESLKMASKTTKCPTKPQKKKKKSKKPPCPPPPPPPPLKYVCPPPSVCPSAPKPNRPHSPQPYGISLKVVPSNKCTAWETIPKEYSGWENAQSVPGCEIVKLNSTEKITIKLKQSPNIDEMRKKMDIKVQDEDGMTLYERKDYVCERQSSLLKDMYKDSNINRISTPLMVTNLTSETDRPIMNKLHSDQGLGNAIEIQFKLRIRQGDKTTEICIGKEEEKKQSAQNENAKKCEGCEPEVYNVTGHAEDVVDNSSAKNDISIKIIVRNFKSKAENPKEKIGYYEDFTKKISEKIDTVATGYSHTYGTAAIVLDDHSNEHHHAVDRAGTTPFIVSSHEDYERFATSYSDESIKRKNKRKPSRSKSNMSIESDEEIKIIRAKNESDKIGKTKLNYTQDEANDCFTYCNENTKLSGTIIDPVELGPTVMQKKTKIIESPSKVNSKIDKKQLLKKVFQRAHDKPKSKECVRQLIEMLKIILTDSSDNDDTMLAVASNELAKNVTYTSLKPNYFRDTDSMNNYYKMESDISSKYNSLTEQPHTNHCEAEKNSYVSVNETLPSPRGCVCSKVVEKINIPDIECCCRKNLKQNYEINCNLYEEFNKIDCSDAMTQNSNQSKENTPLPKGSNHFKENNVKPNEEQVVIKEEIKKSRIKNFLSYKNYKECSKKVKYDKEMNENQIVLMNNEAHRERNSKRFNAADTLQCYETKKAVLEIYAQKSYSENGEHLVAKLPKFLHEKESEIERNYDKIATNRYRSVCTKNIFYMSVGR